jgi:hypothetical protein
MKCTIKSRYNLRGRAFWRDFPKIEIPNLRIRQALKKDSFAEGAKK